MQVRHKLSRSAPLATSALLFAPLLLALLAPSASAFHVGPILAVDFGTPEGAGALDLAGIPPCSAAISPFCYDLVAPAAVAANLPHRDVLYVPWTEGADPSDLAALDGQLGAISAWVTAGGGIVGLAEYAIGNYGWVPGAPFGVAAQHSDDVVITAAGSAHPTHLGQTTATLSGWGNSRHNSFTSYPGYLDVLSRTNTGWPVSLAGHYGEGCVFVTGQDPDWHSYYGSTAAANEMVRNSVTWASRCQCHVECEPEMRDTGQPDVVDPHGPIVLPSILPREYDVLAPVEDDRYPRFFGTTTVDLETCGCQVADWRLDWRVSNDVAPINDAIGPVVTQIDPDTFTVSAADMDTYFITFTVWLKCPDGSLQSVSQSWYQRN